MFAVPADTTRLHLLWLLAHKESDVGSFAERCIASRAAVGPHLANYASRAWRRRGARSTMSAAACAAAVTSPPSAKSYPAMLTTGCPVRQPTTDPGAGQNTALCGAWPPSGRRRVFCRADGHDRRFRAARRRGGRAGMRQAPPNPRGVAGPGGYLPGVARGSAGRWCRLLHRGSGVGRPWCEEPLGQDAEDDAEDRPQHGLDRQ